LFIRTYRLLTGHNRRGHHPAIGWCGTGYRFAPWVGRVLAQLALQQGTVYGIGRFTPARFGVAS